MTFSTVRPGSEPLRPEPLRPEPLRPEPLRPEPLRPEPLRPEPLRPEPLRIDCDDCSLQHTEACADCVVTFLCTREADDAVIIDVAEVRALQLLSDTGLAPQLRHRRRTG